jgi:hypothetical protein
MKLYGSHGDDNAVLTMVSRLCKHATCYSDSNVFADNPVITLNRSCANIAHPTVVTGVESFYRRVSSVSVSVSVNVSVRVLVQYFQLRWQGHGAKGW